MKYSIYCPNPCAQFIEISLVFHCKANEKIYLQFPAWRPGRYEIANYIQKLKGLKLRFNQQQIALTQLQKDQWFFEALGEGEYQISYLFHASQMDAGGSWVCPDFLYLNFSNFAWEISDRLGEEISVLISHDVSFHLATPLEKLNAKELKADNYQELIDSPVLLAENLSHLTYSIEKTIFHIWIHGDIPFDVETLRKYFIGFTKAQIEGFGEFPSNDYHFMLFLLPYTHYHGVEHAKSTVITIGPAIDLSIKTLFDELMGVSSHELYHAWNVCKIRPKELQPYDLSKEILLDAGLIMEGVTTYMGDKMLLHSNYFSIEDYLRVLENQMLKEFHSFGWENESIIQSSLGLWVDGYKTGIPDKKVSIYNRGALLCLCLDILLIQENSSLQKIMKEMYLSFGKTNIGYTLENYKMLIYNTSVNGKNKIEEFFTNCIYGHHDLFPYLISCLKVLGIECELALNKDQPFWEYGLKLDENNKIVKIHHQAEAYEKLMIGDIISTVNEGPFDEFQENNHVQLNLQIIRWNRLYEFTLTKRKSETHYPLYHLKLSSPNPFTNKWLNHH